MSDITQFSKAKKWFKVLVLMGLVLTLSASLSGCMLHYYQQARLAETLADVSVLPLRTPTTVVAADADSLNIRLLTYNVWALPLYIPGSDRKLRLRQIPPAIIEQQADVVALQEAFEPLFREHLGNRLAAYETASDLVCTRDTWPFGQTDCAGGLATFSRWPILEHEFSVHPLLPDPKWDENGGQKGFEISVIDTPLTEVVIVNVHLYAGRNAADEAQRESQINNIITKLQSRNLFEKPIILLGDLNTSHPNLGSLGIDQALSSALADLLGAGFSLAKPDIGESDLTYDVATNRYANLWFNRFEQRQIFDYVLSYSPKDIAVSVISYDRLFDDQPLLSDHFGIAADIQIERRQ